MKTISFSAVEILPALLNKTKTQTIRPLWKDNGALYNNKFVDGGFVEQKIIKRLVKETKPRFKIGEKVRLYWKQRSMYKEFILPFCSHQ